MADLFYFRAVKGFPEWETAKAVEWLIKNEGKKCWAELGRETGVRTEPQNRSLHKYLTTLAAELNAGGFSLKFSLGTKEIDLEWTMEKCKELIWRPIQIALTGKKSTKDLDKVSEIDSIYEHLNRFFSQEPFMLHIPWPSEASIRPVADSKLEI